jgi:RNA-directed DNA polymerase
VTVEGGGAVVPPHSTWEGGEPQGSRKGRPRYPLEGRGEQVDASTRSRIREAQNSRTDVKRELSRLAELAKEDPGRKFFSIAHLLTPQAMYEAFLSLRKDASAGVDRVTYADYEKQAHQNIKELHERLKG